jgi:hypothetical protein
MASFLTRYREGSIWDYRGRLAFALAPLAPALGTALLGSNNFLAAAPLMAIVSYGWMLVFGLPLAMLLNRYRKISLLTCLLGSTAAGALPSATFIGLSLARGQTPMDINAITETIPFIFFFSGMGLFAGIVWWWIACYKKSPITV